LSETQMIVRKPDLEEHELLKPQARSQS
jgi:hypothetical protein